MYASFTYSNTIVCNTVIKRINTLFFTFNNFIKPHNKHIFIPKTSFNVFSAVTS